MIHEHKNVISSIFIFDGTMLFTNNRLSEKVFLSILFEFCLIIYLLVQTSSCDNKNRLPVIIFVALFEGYQTEIYPKI